MLKGSPSNFIFINRARRFNYTGNIGQHMKLIPHFLAFTLGTTILNAQASEQVLTDSVGNGFGAEITSTQNSSITWQIFYAAYKSICRGRLAEADRWIMYAKQKAPYMELMKTAEDDVYLSKSLTTMADPMPKMNIASDSCDLVVR